MFVFHIRYQWSSYSDQPKQVKFNNSERITTGVGEYALFPTNILLSIRNDAQTHCDLEKLRIHPVR